MSSVSLRYSAADSGYKDNISAGKNAQKGRKKCRKRLFFTVFCDKRDESGEKFVILQASIAESTVDGAGFAREAEDP